MNKAQKCVSYGLGFLPSKLPVGLDQFESYCSSIFETYSLPDLPSYRNAIATMIMHLAPTSFYKPKFYFAKSVKKAMANQTAYEVIQRIRDEEKKKEQEALELKQKEVTIPTGEATPEMNSVDVITVPNQ